MLVVAQIRDEISLRKDGGLPFQLALCLHSLANNNLAYYNFVNRTTYQAFVQPFPHLHPITTLFTILIKKKWIMHALWFRQEGPHFLQAWYLPSRSLLPCCRPRPLRMSLPLYFRLINWIPSSVFYPFYRRHRRRWGRARLRSRC